LCAVEVGFVSAEVGRHKISTNNERRLIRMKTKAIATIIMMLFLASMTTFAVPVKAGSGPITKTYDDITLPQGGGFFWLPDVWDLTECEVTVSCTLDLAGAPNQAYYWMHGGPFAAGYVGLVWPGSPWAGACMCGFLTDWDNPDTLFPAFPDRDNSLDMDDKLNMQRFPNSGSWDELMYDVHCPTEIVSPAFGSYDNYGIWFDRDGVDPWQPTYWGMVDGGTYNTGGIYEVQLTYHMASSTKGTACPLLFPDLENDDAPGGYGIPTGFNRLSPGPGYADFPAGISFDTDEAKMAYMQVFVSGDSGDGTIVVRDLTVTGCLTTPKKFKQLALDELNDICPTGDKKVDHKLDKAIDSIGKSLESDLWVDDNHIDPKHGNKVFDEERKAVKELMELADKEDTPQGVKDTCRAVIGKLIKADDIIAHTVYEEAQAYAGDPKVDKELEKCDKEFGKAVDKLGEGKFDEAVDHYKKAWEHAQNALKHT